MKTNVEVAEAQRQFLTLLELAKGGDEIIISTAMPRLHVSLGSRSRTERTNESLDCTRATFPRATISMHRCRIISGSANHENPAGYPHLHLVGQRTQTSF